MKLVAICSLLVALTLREATGGAIRNPPAFSNPVYSNSYVPAAMQVIFHAVEQLKQLQKEENTASFGASTTASFSASTAPASSTTQHQETSILETTTVSSKITTESSSKEKEEGSGSKDEQISKGVEESTRSGEIGDESIIGGGSSIGEGPSNEEAAEVNAETPETNYATPEANYEAPEDVHEVEEPNEEVPEENQEFGSATIGAEASSFAETKLETTTESGDSSSSVQVESIAIEKKQPTIDSVVQNVYEILKPTPSHLVDEEAVPSGESKNANGAALEKTEKVEEDSDENRFTRLGERVTQVPRPSLISYLKRSKVPPSATLQQLANLYDSLSKDARKQGFGKYTGYSDEVLNTLRTSAEGGISPQLKKILDKIVERNELTREDAKIRTSQTIRDLENPSSALSKELRPLLPLRYAP